MRLILFGLFCLFLAWSFFFSGTSRRHYVYWDRSSFSFLGGVDFRDLPGSDRLQVMTTPEGDPRLVSPQLFLSANFRPARGPKPHGLPFQTRRGIRFLDPKTGSISGGLESLQPIGTRSISPAGIDGDSARNSIVLLSGSILIEVGLSDGETRQRDLQFPAGFSVDFFDVEDGQALFEGLGKLLFLDASGKLQPIPLPKSSSDRWPLARYPKWIGPKAFLVSLIAPAAEASGLFEARLLESGWAWKRLVGLPKVWDLGEYSHPVQLAFGRGGRTFGLVSQSMEGGGSAVLLEVQLPK